MGIQRLRASAKTFNKNAAVGVDVVRPRHCAMASDEASSCLGRVLYLCEQWAIWPSMACCVQILLLAEPAGCRLIALRSSICRLRARARLDRVRARAPRRGRSRATLGEGKAATDVAAR
eukprot:6336082-Pyramimonas_sp.AAC.1